MKLLKNTLMLLAFCTLGYSLYQVTSPWITAQLGMTEPMNIQAAAHGNYVGSYYKGNYVWGGAMNLAWNELSDSIIGGPIELKTSDPVAQDMNRKFNARPFAKNDLDEASYYIKSGFGQSTVTAINTESKAKFPEKSFSNLQLQLLDTDIIAYAYFLKKVQYVVEFTEQVVSFESQAVQGFVATNPQQKTNIQVVSYTNDDKFIIMLRLQDPEDQVIVAKGYDMNGPLEIVKEIADLNTRDLEPLRSADNFKMPKIHLSHERTYDELIGVKLNNLINGHLYEIKYMFEKIKFDLDHKGARVENEAVIGLSRSSASMPDKDEKPRNFFLDKPFWVVMKRTSSQNPYFLLGVSTTDVLEVK